MPTHECGPSRSDLIAKSREARDELARLKVTILADSVDTSTPPAIGAKLGSYVAAIDAAYLDLVELGYQLLTFGD